MAIRSIAQVAAGVLTGAALVGVPTWAVASQQDGAASSRSDMSSMMNDSQSQTQMMSSMSKMMDDPQMRKQMRSMMSDAMGGMSGMDGKMSRHGTSGIGQMHNMGRGSK